MVTSTEPSYNEYIESHIPATIWPSRVTAYQPHLLVLLERQHFVPCVTVRLLRAFEYSKSKNCGNLKFCGDTTLDAWNKYVVKYSFPNFKKIFQTDTEPRRSPYIVNVVCYFYYMLMYTKHGKCHYVTPTVFVFFIVSVPFSPVIS